MNILAAKQKIFSATSETAIGVELLARWRLVSGGIISPAIAQPRDWGAVDLEIAAQAAQRQLIGDTDDGLLFLNASEALLSNPKRVVVWMSHVQFIQKCGNQCVIEITEGVTDQTLNRQWSMLHHNGLLLALDDFGTALSTPDRLTAFAWDYCKIDARLIGTVNTNWAIKYCLETGVKVVAECVEDEGLRQLAVRSGAVLHQGFFWGAPSIGPARGRGQVLAC